MDHNKLDEILHEIKTIKLDMVKMEEKVEKTYSKLFESNGEDALITQVRQNRKYAEENHIAIKTLTIQETGKWLKNLIAAGKIAASVSAIAGTLVGGAYLITSIADKVPL